MQKTFQQLANFYRRGNCDNKARPLLEGELHPGCFNYCGPQTRIDLPEVRNYPPYNDIDRLCRDHDIHYEQAKRQPSQKEQEVYRRKADKYFLQELEKYRDQSGYSLAKGAISGKVGLEDLIPGLVRRVLPEHIGRRLGGQIPLAEEHLMSAKPYPEAYTREIVKNIIILSAQPGGARPFGSFIYRSQPYPSDIDLIEPEVYTCSKTCSDFDGTNNAVKIFKSVVERVQRTRGVFLGDIKLGVDLGIYLNLFDQYWGWGVTVKESLPWDRDTSKVESMEFRPDMIARCLKAMSKAGWIKPEKERECLKILKSKDDTFTKRCKVIELLRKLNVLRWNYNEIHKGYKKLGGNRKVTMYEALKFVDIHPTREYDTKRHVGPEVYFDSPGRSLSDDEYLLWASDPDNLNEEVRDELTEPLTKVDMFTQYAGKFTEMTNLMTFMYETRERPVGVPSKRLLTHGQKENVQLSYGHSHLVEELQVEIAKYYWNPVYDKPLKYAKRLYALSRNYDDANVARKCVDLFHSDINYLNMVNSQLDMFQNMIKFIPPKKLPLAEMKREIQDVKLDLGKMINIDWGGEATFKKLDQMTEPGVTPEELNEHLDQLHEEFAHRIKEDSRAYLKRVGLYPAPRRYLNREHFAILI